MLLLTAGRQFTVSLLLSLEVNKSLLCDCILLLSVDLGEVPGTAKFTRSYLKGSSEKVSKLQKLYPVIRKHDPTLLAARPLPRPKVITKVYPGYSGFPMGYLARQIVLID